jgi:hypothetical protein
MIRLQPTFRYWVMSNFLWFVLLSLLCSAVFLNMAWYVSYVIGCIVLLILCRLGWHLIVLRHIEYVIDEEQVIMRHGVFRRITNYMEMYRIFDYQKRQNIVEALFGVMNVILLSRDLSNPKTVLFGIRNDDSVIPLIRNRVETQKARKGIYEFNNPAF